MVTSAANDGAVQLTEMVELTGLGSVTVGWFASLLHSRMLPIEFLANPAPVMVTAVPLARPVFGVTVMVVAAKSRHGRADQDRARHHENRSEDHEAFRPGVAAPCKDSGDSRPTRPDHGQPPASNASDEC